MKSGPAAIPLASILIDFFFLPTFLSAQLEQEVYKKFAPDFEMTMLDGTKKKLSDFKGQVIYIRFWASWCKPCIEGFEKYRDTRDSLRNMGVLMLNISIDDSDNKWRKAITDIQPTGSHAIVPHGLVRKPYQLYSVPLYEIVGKRGQLVYLSDDPERNIYDNFNQFLEEK